MTQSRRSPENADPAYAVGQLMARDAVHDLAEQDHAQTVNLKHIASERPSRAMAASTCRRLQRLFHYVCLPEDWCAGIVISLLGNPRPWHLGERCFNKLKKARRVATRYAKTAESFAGFVDITSIRLGLRHL